jgi:hypothetical protein
MYGIVAFEILFYYLKNRYQYLILFQIIILTLFSVCSELLIFPNIIGIDPWSHQRITMMIVNSGFIPNGSSYSMIPFFHLEIGSTVLITGLDYKFASLLSISLLQILCSILFIYILGKFLFNIRIGLLGGLLLSIGNFFIDFSFAPIPNTIAAIIMIIIIYLIFKFDVKNHFIKISLIALFMISLIFTHTVTSMCMAIILFVSLICSYIFRTTYFKNNKKFVTINMAAFFSVAMFSWWIYGSGHINTLADFIQAGFRASNLIFAPKEVTEFILKVPQIEQIFNVIGLFLFFSISVIGCFYMISKKYGNALTLSFSIIGITPLAIGFISLITGYYLIPERWWYFSQILLAIPISLTFILLCNKIKRKSLKTLFLFFLITFLTFAMIISPTANLDNRIFSQNTGLRSALTKSEITAASFFAEKSAATLSSDFDYFTNPSSSILINYFNINSTRIKSLDQSILTRKFDRNYSIIVIREEIITQPFRIFGQTYKLDYNLKKSLEIQGFSVIYDSNSVSGYTS